MRRAALALALAACGPASDPSGLPPGTVCLERGFAFAGAIYGEHGGGLHAVLREGAPERPAVYRALRSRFVECGADPICKCDPRPVEAATCPPATAAGSEEILP